MMKNTNYPEYLIFDMGNVIIDIDIPLTINKLKTDLMESEFHLAENFLSSRIHMDFESGAIDEAAFRDGVRKDFKKEWEDSWIDDVWNTLLLTIPGERVQLLKALRKNHKLYLLSNTNSIHFKVVEEIYRRDNGNSNESFRDLFDHLFLSYEMGLQKPDKKIYTTVVETIGAKPEECLFFDDLEENLTAAKEVGIQTHLISHPKALTDYFSHVQ